MGISDGRFSVASFFIVVSGGSLVSSLLACLWSFKVPPRVVVFGWLAILGKITLWTKQPMVSQEDYGKWLPLPHVLG